MDLQMLGEEGVSTILLHATVEWNVRLLPFDTVGKLNVDRVSVGDVHSAQRVRADVDLDNAIVVVRDIEVHVREEVVPHLRLPGLENFLDLSNEAPDGEVVIVHLEVVVVLHGFSKLFQILCVELLPAQALVVAIDAERHVVRGTDHPVSLQYLAQVLWFVPGAALRGAEGQIVVLIRLARVVEGSHFVGVQRHLLVHLVGVVRRRK
mmetsp:Transcript_1377/g.3065  ORF Transcript_1377/g.3065 Transcript_1377/m.3065 type:complete len:207 (-) Transcript_1377:186-806(-)